MEDAVTLVANPDESWGPERKWYEAHLHGRTVHAWGFTYPGLPLPVFGHNRRSGWGRTQATYTGFDSKRIRTAATDGTGESGPSRPTHFI